MNEAELKEIVDKKEAAEILDVDAQKARVEANKAAESVDPLESEEVQIAAGYYAKLSKQIKGYSSVMNGKGLARVMVALAEFPYADSYPTFKKGSQEQHLFTLMLTIQSAKAKIAAALQPQLDAIQNAAVDGIVKEEMDKITEKQGEADGNKVD